MSAPVIWILIPLFTAALLLTIKSNRIVILVAGILTGALVFIAVVIPVDTPLGLGELSFKISPALYILGRRIMLTSADQPLLVMIYGAALLWFLVASAVGCGKKMIPLGLMVTAFLVSSLAVEPILYGSLLIEMAVLLSVPLVFSPGRDPGRGLLRFLLIQTLALPLLLFSGWLLAGIEANPGDQTLMLLAAVMLGLGFCLLLAVFPFSTWMLELVQDTPPCISGFILWSFPTAGLLYLTNFIERYTWLRSAPELPILLSAAGVLMLITGGILAIFQKHLGRILACAVMMETGLSLLILSLNSLAGIGLFFSLFVPRLVALLTWSLALTILGQHDLDPTFAATKGLVRHLPYTAAAIIITNLSLVGFPLFAGFPVRLAIISALRYPTGGIGFWIFIGSFGLGIAVIRTLNAFTRSPEGEVQGNREGVLHKITLGIGLALLCLAGLFPQWVALIMKQMPVIFQHIGQ